MEGPARNQGLLYALAAVLLWSTVATAFKLSLQSVGVSQLVTGAALFSALSLAGVLAWQGHLGRALKDLGQSWPSSLGRGVLNPVLYYAVLFEAYSRLPAQIALSLNYTWPMTLSLLAVPLLKQHLTRANVLAMLVGYCGVVLVAVAGRELVGVMDLGGMALALASTVLWSLYWLLGTRDPREPAVALFQNFLMALPLLLAWTMLGVGLPPLDEWRAWGGMAYVGCFEMGITFLLWQLALKHSENVSRLGNLVFLSPFLSLLFIRWLLAERLLPLTFVGLSLIVAGVWWQERQRVRG